MRAERALAETIFLRSFFSCHQLDFVAEELHAKREMERQIYRVALPGRRVRSASMLLMACVRPRIVRD